MISLLLLFKRNRVFTSNKTIAPNIPLFEKYWNLRIFLTSLSLGSTWSLIISLEAVFWRGAVFYMLPMPEHLLRHLHTLIIATLFLQGRGNCSTGASLLKPPAALLSQTVATSGRAGQEACFIIPQYRENRDTVRRSRVHRAVSDSDL